MNRKIAIVTHVYYPELWDELSNCIRNFNDHTVDLFITTPLHDESLKKKIYSEYPQSDYRILENRGYDVGPFIEFLNNTDLSRYDYIVKLHTKGNCSGWFNYMYVSGSRWRNLLLSFCKTKKDIDNTIRLLEDNKNAGMAANASLIVTHGDFLESETVKQRAEQLLRTANLTPQKRIFVGGTMFIVRARLFKPLQGLRTIKDFEPVLQHECGTLAHSFERLMGYIISAQNMEIVSIGTPQNKLSYIWPLIISIYKLLSLTNIKLLFQKPKVRHLIRRITANYLKISQGNN